MGGGTEYLGLRPGHILAERLLLLRAEPKPKDDSEKSSKYDDAGNLARGADRKQIRHFTVVRYRESHREERTLKPGKPFYYEKKKLFVNSPTNRNLTPQFCFHDLGSGVIVLLRLCSGRKQFTPF